MNTKDEILTILARSASLATEDLIALIGKSYASVHTSLRRLSRRNKVVENADGTWSLFAKAPVAITPTPAAKPAPTAKPIGLKYAPDLPPLKKRRTKAIVVVDVSGSMNSYRYQLNESLNKTLADLRSDAFRTGETIDVSLYYFNDHVTPVYKDVDARDVKSEGVRYPDGGTALFDTVTTAINDHLRPERSDEDVAYLLIVQTDGQDEHSRDRYGTIMKDLVRKVQGTDRWTITFQLPPGFLQKFCNTYGIHPGNCTEWERTEKGFETATVQRSAATSTYMTNRMAGQLSTKSFYATIDLDKLNVNAVKGQLDDIAAKIKKFEVSKEMDIKAFIEEATGHPYSTGSVFYQLTKSEKVQPGKKLLVTEKGKKAVYAGDQARSLIGLPVGVNVRVKPGNLSNFDVFVQSTSVNRKLVRGTKVVHWPLSLQ